MMRPLALLAAALLLVGASSKKDTLVHVVEAGDTLWSISAKPDVYDDPYLWPVIYKFNRDQIQDPARIYPRQRLLIPIHVQEPARSDARSQAGAPAPGR